MRQQSLDPINHAERIALRPQEAANALGISLRTLMSMVAGNEIPFTRIGERNLRFPLSALATWLAARTAWPTGFVAAEQQVQQ